MKLFSQFFTNKYRVSDCFVYGLKCLKEIRLRNLFLELPAFNCL